MLIVEDSHDFSRGSTSRLNEKYSIEYSESQYTKSLYLSDELERHDKRLIECIETLGSKKASGEFSNIVVEEFQSDMYYIEEYDGLETIVTPEMINWIKIYGEEKN